MSSHVSRVRIIAAGAPTIWDVLADFGELSAWAQKIDHSSVLEHGHDGAVGTIRRVQVGRNTLVERITEFSPPTTLAYDIAGLPAWLGRLSNRWSLQPSGTGTAVTVTSTVDHGTPRRLQKVTDRVICRVLAEQSDSMLAGLANTVENPRGR